jgi:phospholipid/cholesterol/gamma-HCH transport system substrate-binding protein
METRAHYVAVGGFVVTIIFLAFAAVLWLGRAQLSTQYARYDIYFRGAVTGLSVGAPVQYAGIPVGHVVSIEVDSNNVEQIKVEIEVDTGTVIKSDAVAGLETNLLSGVSTIQISGGKKDSPVLAAKDGERYPVITSRRNDLALVYTRVPKLLDRANELIENLNEVLNDTNRKAIAATVENLRVASAGLADGSKTIGPLSDDARNTLRAVSNLVSNVDHSYSDRDGLKDQVGVALADFDRLAKGLNDSNRSLQGILQDARPGVKDLSSRAVGNLNDLLLEARQLVSGLSRLASQLERDPSRVLYGDRREGYQAK